MELIKSSEIVKYQFYIMPKELFESKKYKDISLEAKVIYTLFIDRLELSRKNNWINEKGEVYLIFKRNDIAEILNLTDKTVSKAIKELKKIELVYENRQGLGKPNLIYIGKLNSESQETENLQFRTSKNSETEIGKNTETESENFRGNNTNINNTNLKNNKISQSVKYNELEEIKEKCELHLLEEVDSYGNVNTQLKNMVENAIELMYYSSSIKVNNAIIPQELVRNKLKELNGAKIFYALEKIKNNLKNTQNFTNSTRFIISCLYNAINEYFSDAELQFRIDGG